VSVVAGVSVVARVRAGEGEWWSGRMATVVGVGLGGYPSPLLSFWYKSSLAKLNWGSSPISIAHLATWRAIFGVDTRSIKGG
jgi:hypothetical protein